MVRFTFPADTPANVVLPISHTLNNTMGAEVHLVGDREMEGYVENQVFCGAEASYKVDYGSVAQIQEDVIAYASLYRLAKEPGKSPEAKTMCGRALYCRSVSIPRAAFSDHGMPTGPGWRTSILRKKTMASSKGPAGAINGLRQPLWPGWRMPWGENDSAAPHPVLRLRISRLVWAVLQPLQRDSGYFERPSICICANTYVDVGSIYVWSSASCAWTFLNALSAADFAPYCS